MNDYYLLKYFFMTDNNKFIDLDNIKVVWENINDRFVRKIYTEIYDLSKETFSKHQDTYEKISPIYNNTSNFNMSDNFKSFLENNNKKVLKDLDGIYYNIIGVYKAHNSQNYSILLNKVGDFSNDLTELSFIEIFYKQGLMFEYQIKWSPLIPGNDLSSYDIK